MTEQIKEGLKAWNTRHINKGECEWISINDRLPEYKQECLILIDVGGNIERGKYIGNGIFEANWCTVKGKNQLYKVTHWMPLPKLPKEIS